MSLCYCLDCLVNEKAFSFNRLLKQFPITICNNLQHLDIPPLHYFSTEKGKIRIYSDLFSMIKTIQDKKFNNTIVTYVTTMKVMTKTITTIVTKMDKYKKCFEKRACRKLSSLIIKPWVFT